MRRSSASLDMCRALLFPGYAGPDVARLDERELRELVRLRLDELRVALHRQVYRASHHKRQQTLGKNELECADCTRKANDITERFIAQLPELRARRSASICAPPTRAIRRRAAIDEILLTYPGAYAITVYRIAHALLREGARR